MLAIRLSRELESRIDRLARSTGRTKTFYARQAIEEHIGDLEDAYQAHQSRGEIAGGGYLLSHEEAHRELEPQAQEPQSQGSAITGPQASGTQLKPAVKSHDLEAFCQRHGVVRFSLFGSILRDDFANDSDVDVLLDMGKRKPGYDEHVAMIRELKALFGRSVDLVYERVLRSGRTHPSIVANIMKSKKSIYTAP